jgi:hypothetical protein
MIGASRGQTALWASFGRLRSQELSVMVLEEGMFRLLGGVTRTGGGFVSAIVSVVDRSGHLQEMSTDLTEGEYRVYVLGGPVRVTITAASHVTLIEDFVVSDHMLRNFTLSPVAP